MAARNPFPQRMSPIASVAAIAVILSSLLAACSIWHAMKGDAPLPKEMTSAHRHITVQPDSVPIPASLIDDAVEQDPFNGSRRRPGKHFHFPGENSQPDSTARAPESTQGTPRLIGTVVRASGGGFAVCQLGGGAPKVLHVNERLGALTLKHVTQERAVFIDANGATIVLSTLGTGG